LRRLTVGCDFTRPGCAGAAARRLCYRRSLADRDGGIATGATFEEVDAQMGDAR
jgi:hypothetical protein